MYFVEGGGEKNETERPDARPRNVALFLFETAIGERRQQEIHRDVSEFTNNQMTHLELLHREPGKEERQNRKERTLRIRA